MNVCFHQGIHVRPSVLCAGTDSRFRTPGGRKPGIASFAMGAASMTALAILYYGVMVLKIGILGAGIYYGCTLGLSFMAILYFLFNRDTIFKIRLSDLKIDFSLVAASFKIALPYLGFQAAIFISTLVINHLLGRYGSDLELAAFGIINSYIAYTVMIFSQTMANGLQPIASFNYGAGKPDVFWNCSGRESGSIFWC